MAILPLGLVQRPNPADPCPMVIYHGGGCPDGFAAALAAWLFFDGRGDYLAIDHGDLKSTAELPTLAGRNVYVLDFSFDEPFMQALDAQAAQLIVLDHHKSAQDKLAHFRCRCGVLHFDLKKSGARLAWEYFLPDHPLPALVRFVEDRDLWAWKVDGSASFLAALDVEKQNFARWHAIAQFTPAQVQAYVERGRAMDEKFLHLADGIAEGAKPVVFNGVRGLMANAPNVFHSQLGNMLSQKSGTFALLWSIHKSGAIKVGLRSQPGFDCIPMAQSMGGGGHPQASAFRMDAGLLPQLIAGQLSAPGPGAPP
jgi:uncharacterized protein